MKALVLFAGSRCAEFSPQALLQEIPFAPEAWRDCPADMPVATFLSLPCNVRTDLGGGVQGILVDAPVQFYSTINLSPVHIGEHSRDDIRLFGTAAALSLYTDKLEIFYADDVYINGQKVKERSCPLLPGDCIWIGAVRLTVHAEYVECAGMAYISSLNLSVRTPEPYEGFPIYKRSPRLIKRAPSDSLELNAPPAVEGRKRGELVKIILPPLLMMIVTVGAGVMMGRGLMMMVSAVGMFLSLVFSITTFFGDKKEQRQKKKEREENYERYLLAQRKRLYELHEAQRTSLLYHNLSPTEIEQEILFYSSRLYERPASDSDFLTLSLGYSHAATSYKLKYNADAADAGKDPLTDEMRELGDRYRVVPDMPTVIDLKQAHLGLVGEKPHIHRQLAALLLQLCFFQSYHDLEIVLLVKETDRARFEWLRWAPHCRVKTINITGLVSAENQRDQVLGNIAQMLKSRRQKQSEEKKDSLYLPHYLFIVDNPKLIINHSIMEYLQEARTTLGFSIIWTTNIQANLPENIHTVFLLDGKDNGILLMNEGKLLRRSVALPQTNGIDFERAARKLAPVKHSQGISTQIPESVSFFDLYGFKRPEEFPIQQLWAQNACHKSLAVPLGLRGKDDVVALNLHEKAHGPHGLVAGTTGSGKSEIVQSYILSLAVNFHPHEVGFLLIDYKGGGMANLFENLPHLLGTITNLDGSESMRALASIKSELARRQRVFNDSGVNSINQYTKLFKAGEATLPLPHLFLISDEFAELKKEQPEFMSELVSAARIGRSLGVHLILATQKPSGVVDDQIWSNSKFKLALKVANESDSNEVLKTPDAARITQPGRAYLQVGNNEIYELFQSAWSGAAYSEGVVSRGFDSRVYLVNPLGQGELLNKDLSEVDQSQDSKFTQLDVLVNHIHDLYSKMGEAPVDKPWLPPLPARIVNPHIQTDCDVGQIETLNLTVPVGMVDIPEQQNQIPYVHDFLEDGNFAVFGASGFGKSTVAMNTALSLGAQNSPALLNFFILDYGNSALAQLRGLPHTADYLGFDDAEKLVKLIKLLSEELKNRKALFANKNALNFRMYNSVSEEKLPAILVIIDNYDVIRELSPELEEFLVRLTRDGTGVGVYTHITATRTNAVRYSVLNNFKNKISQFMFDSSDITAVVGRSAYKLPEVRGRALVKLADVHVAQCYLPAEREDDISYANLVGEMVAQIAQNNTASKAAGIRMLADTVMFADLSDFLKPNEKQAALGFDPETTDPLYLDLSIPVQMIVGAPTTGKTNILKLLLAQFGGAVCFIADSRAGDLQDYEGRQGVTYMGSEAQLDEFFEKLSEETQRRQQLFDATGGRIRDFCAVHPVALALIDDADNFVELCKTKAKEMEQLIPRAMEMGIVFVVTTTPGKMRGYDNLTKVLKETQSGIVLGNPGDQSILSVSPPRGYKPVSDIGFWFKRGTSRQVKIPFIRS